MSTNFTSMNGVIMKVIFEDKHILVVEKPQNIPIQRDRKGSVNLLDQALDYLEFSCGIDSPYLGLVHRLDRHTGGIVVFAKHLQATRTLSELFASHMVNKQYLARVEGEVKSNHSKLTHYLLPDPSKNSVSAVPRGVKGAKEAILDITVTSVYHLAEGDLSDVIIKLHTGRQHQIRVQLSAIGHPILGDEKYGASWSSAYRNSMTLWSTSLSFNAFGIKYEFHSTPPFEGNWKIL